MTLSTDTEDSTEEPATGAQGGRRIDVEMPDTDDQMMDSLRSHVPITLLMDLSSPDGPHSAEISQQEGGDADWLGLSDDRDAG